jgi:hypothetical protein
MKLYHFTPTHYFFDTNKPGRFEFRWTADLLPAPCPDLGAIMGEDLEPVVWLTTEPKPEVRYPVSCFGSR